MKNEALIQQAYELFGVSNVFELQKAYTLHDQALMKSNQWNAYNTELIINRAKIILEQIDLQKLTDDERFWFTELLWFWYHHAISCETLRTNAQKYAEKALSLMSDDHPNRITRLLWYLTKDDVIGAKAWLNTKKELWDEVEFQTGKSLVEEYQRRTFWV